MAYLIYSNDPYDSDSIQVQSVNGTIYTYGIEVTDVDNSDSSNVLEGGNFNLLDEEGSTLYFVEADGAYYLADSTDDDVVTDLVSDSSGIVNIYGLDEGTYTLEQISAPDGYILNTTSQTITIADSDLDGLLDYDENDDNGIYEVTFTNGTGFSLPTTGGVGTMIFTILGIVLIAGGIVLIVVKSRKQKA